MGLLRELALVGPSITTTWAIRCELLLFTSDGHFLIGPMLARVLEACEWGEERREDFFGNSGEGEIGEKAEKEEKVIHLSHQKCKNESDSLLFPPEGKCPFRWGQLCRSLKGEGGESTGREIDHECKKCGGEMGEGEREDEPRSLLLSPVDIKMELTASCIQVLAFLSSSPPFFLILLLSFLSLFSLFSLFLVQILLMRSKDTTALARDSEMEREFLVVNTMREEENFETTMLRGGGGRESLQSVEGVRISLSPPEDECGRLGLIMKATKSNTTEGEEGEQREERVDINDYRFHLRDVVVLVASKPAHVTEEDAVLGGAGGEVEEQVEDVEVVRLVMEDEAPMPLIPFHLFATRIQRMAREKHRKRSTNAKILQAVYRSYRLLMKWRGVVGKVWSRSVQATERIQTVFRGWRARNRFSNFTLSSHSILFRST